MKNRAADKTPQYEPLPISKGHSAIYKQHRYFARRPHNQFRAVIEKLTEPNDIILDSFAGGGVTLIEGLTTDRRVIACDINPIASLVQASSAVEVEYSRVEQLLTQIQLDFPGDLSDSYITTCRSCKSDADVRWFEHAYEVSCPSCTERTQLSNRMKDISSSGKPRAGFYRCERCDAVFKSVDTPRLGSSLLGLRYRCTSCGSHENALPIERDVEQFRKWATLEAAVVKEKSLHIPYAPIPNDWDRQAEDALARKGLASFSDLFTSRNRLALAFLFRSFEQRAPGMTDEEYIVVLHVLSALIRYVNNMTISTGRWMDGRPVAWAKHAYWIPNQFVECNPLEYLDHRLSAVKSACKDRKSRFQDKKRSNDPADVIAGNADYSIITGDSRALPIPSGSVDAVITDPPFGSNVQYGELTEVWNVWIKELNPFRYEASIEDEILVHRKRRTGSKTLKYYEEGLKAVFAECFRTLTDKGLLGFTFNNKDSNAWFAVMSAAFDAGFSLGAGDIFYQPPINAYRDTAHLRFDSELQGDVFYVFRKGEGVAETDLLSIDAWRDNWRAELRKLNGLPPALDTRVEIHLEGIFRASQAYQAGEKELAHNWLTLSRQLASNGK